MNKNKLLFDDDINILSKQSVPQHIMVTLVTWIDNRVEDFSLSNFNDGYQLSHFSHQLLLLKRKERSKTISSDGQHIVVHQNGDDKIDEDTIAIVAFDRTQYNHLVDSREKYQNWKRQRNETRANLEYQYNYDTKHASHLVRLLRMGEEILTTGQVIVKRPDAQELLDIRNGKYSYDELIKISEEKDNLIRTSLYQNTSLPKKPNYNLAKQLILEIQDMLWKKIG